MTEYGMNSQYFTPLRDEIPNFEENDISEILERELNKSINVLDLTPWIKKLLIDNQICSVKDIITTTEARLKQLYYVGDKRARLVKTAAMASVYEYLNG